MSKKVFTLATTRCGYCKMTESFVKSKFPDIGDKYEYFLYDQDEPTKRSNAVLSVAQSMGVKGVPFTVMIEDDKTVTKVLRGYDPQGITNMLEEVQESKEETGQLEIPFPEE